ncbi:MAG: DUF2183 domain-containing protein [Balneolaceae bacterium]|nr:DUF2183 domain-containing protein [Balneolaceae bacterium]MCH8548329.1 DUF2183 domain-containing protein [Balneolaceae bacterium]
MTFSTILGLMLSLSGLAFAAGENQNTDIDEEVIFYNTYGYLHDDMWIIPMRANVMESRRYLERPVTSLVRRLQNLNSEQEGIFRSRMRYFISDSESREEVVFVFDEDPEETQFQILDTFGEVVTTDANGNKVGEIRISKEMAAELLRLQDSKNGWLTFRAVSDEHTGIGRVRLIEPEGLSVISDVDDTVKVTEIPAGAQIVIRNTFFKEYTAAEGMAEMYREWEDATFHYVSGSPWQLYLPLSKFLFDEADFPEGSFHMKTVTKNMRSISTWRNMRDLITDENMTYDQKITQISLIFEHFPGREFILVGDSGERDPEVYRIIKERFPDQVKEIIIRDVINDREMRPERLEGMTIIEAETIVPGVSQFN